MSENGKNDVSFAAQSSEKLALSVLQQAKRREKDASPAFVVAAELQLSLVPFSICFTDSGRYHRMPYMRKNTSPNEVGGLPGFGFRRIDSRRFSSLNTFEQPGHVVCQSTHGLQAFLILQDFLRSIAMHRIPVLR